jgi:hypothetical protein
MQCIVKYNIVFAAGFSERACVVGTQKLMHRSKLLLNSSKELGYLYSAGYRPKGPVIWTFPICGPKWPIKHSPGFTLGNSPTRISPEGATRYGENRLRTFEPNRVRISSPFRALRLFRLTRVNPGLCFIAPSGRSSGRMIDAIQIRT